MRFYKLTFLHIIGAAVVCGLGSRLAESQEVAAAKPVLSGRITDENGSPVSDARIELFHIETGIGSPATWTANNGNYTVKWVRQRGEYRLLIRSNRCIGFTDYQESPRVMLDPQKPAIHNFVLKLACRLRVQALDEDGHPVRKVQFFSVVGSRSANYPESDPQGWAEIGGLPALTSEYKFGTHSDQFAPMQLRVTLDDPKTVVERKLVMRRGVDVKGTVLCLDGKPAAGWRILALPAWWDFLSSPLGERIKEDGSFVLPHVGPGIYDVTVSVPAGNGSSSVRPVLSGVDLAAQKAPLSIKLEFPSPGSMSQIEGRIRYLGGRPKRGLSVTAGREDGRPFFGSAHVSSDGNDFRIGPLPAGRYRLQFNSDEIEPKELTSIMVPTKDLQVEIRVHGRTSVRGAVFIRNGHDEKPVNDFRVRVVKMRSLRGVASYSSPNWRPVIDSQGRFAEELPGAGIYVIEAIAEGFATARSKPINTDEPVQQDIRIELSRGIPLSGAVVDEEGRPIDGATVISWSRANRHAPVSAVNVSAGSGVKTVGGHFDFAGLDPGRETLHVLHPDYAPLVRTLVIKPTGQAPLTFVMHPGGTVHGHVHDHLGRLAGSVTLHFGRFPSSNNPYDRFATTVTDENGYYEVRHLPAQLIYAHREDEWQTLGVVRQAILPANGKTRTLDFGASSTSVAFGGPAKLGGRLFVRGKPFASKRIVLANHDPNFGIFKAVAQTDADGAFEFRGIPLGKHYLYYSDDGRSGVWHRVHELDITTSRNFGRIDQIVGTLTVRLPIIKSQSNESVRVTLSHESEGPFHGYDAGFAMPRRGKDDPYVFQNAAPGKYAVTARFGERLSLRKVVETTAADPNQTVSLEIPTGTASVHGSVDRLPPDEMMQHVIELQMKDGSLRLRTNVKKEGAFEITDLPPGEYDLVLARVTANSSTLKSRTKLALRAGEVKTVVVPRVGDTQPETGKGILYVTVFTPEGIPLPGCTLQLVRQTETLSVVAVNPDGRVVFHGPEGAYDLKAGFFGFKPLVQRVKLQVMDEDHQDRHDFESNVTLVPLD